MSAGVRIDWEDKVSYFSSILGKNSGGRFNKAIPNSHRN
jgi:hypothetical protein